MRRQQTAGSRPYSMYKWRVCFGYTATAAAHSFLGGLSLCAEATGIHCSEQVRCLNDPFGSSKSLSDHDNRSKFAQDSANLCRAMWATRYRVIDHRPDKHVPRTPLAPTPRCLICQSIEFTVASAHVWKCSAAWTPWQELPNCNCRRHHVRSAGI
jgi:hypothetical protein